MIRKLVCLQPHITLGGLKNLMNLTSGLRPAGGIQEIPSGRSEIEVNLLFL